jgi:hypothetical protein
MWSEDGTRGILVAPNHGHYKENQMLLKIMSAENIPDDDSRKLFMLHSNVASVEFGRWENKPTACVHYLDGTTNETVPLAGNAYLMNDAGKTVASFGAGEHPNSGISMVFPTKMIGAN